MLNLTDTKMTYMFLLLCLVMIIDWLTGTIVAYILKQQNSKIGINGILKKCLIFFVAIIIVCSSIVIPQIYFFTITMLFGLTIMQIQSIIENMEKVNLREAVFLKKLIEQIEKLMKKKE